MLPENPYYTLSAAPCCSDQFPLKPEFCTAQAVAGTLKTAIAMVVKRNLLIFSPSEFRARQDERCLFARLFANGTNPLLQHRSVVVVYSPFPLPWLKISCIAPGIDG